MSRTPKRGKSPGFDYWGKRKYTGMPVGKGVKKISRRIQRAHEKEMQRKEQVHDDGEGNKHSGARGDCGRCQ